MIPVKSIMTTDVISIGVNTPIYEALDILTKRRISGLPVIDSQNRVIGILSEKDLLRVLIDKKLSINNTVEDYMTREVICFSEDDSATDICKFFIRHHIRRVPIVREGVLVGIVSRRDIINLITEAKTKMSGLRYA